ncbi:hypothetical protein IP87_18055 [beta proteobacterium AAP121]|nr:hypothetical protein IP80_10640 [beta proteobacterium AAP65]KPF94842.1 hypothetical protein IP87_18055 [beta proteobacterium AAP121]
MNPRHLARLSRSLPQSLLAGLALSLLLSLAPPARAQAEVQALSTCIAEGATGKDRKDLARWMFVAMAAHPDMRAISSVPAAATDSASRAAGELFTKLLAETCPAQVKAAMQAGGPMAIQAAFQVLGQLAMQELMSDKDVLASMAILERYIDKQKIDAAGR